MALFFLLKQPHLQADCQLNVLYRQAFTNSHFKVSTGPVEVGVQGVPRHTQYLALHLVKIMFIPENSGVGYLCAHPMFRGFP